MPKVEMPKFHMPKVEMPIFHMPKFQYAKILIAQIQESPKKLKNYLHNKRMVPRSSG